MKETQKSVTAITAINSKRLCKNVVFLSEKENVCRQLFSLLDQNPLAVLRNIFYESYN